MKYIALAGEDFQKRNLARLDMPQLDTLPAVVEWITNNVPANAVMVYRIGGLPPFGNFKLVAVRKNKVWAAWNELKEQHAQRANVAGSQGGIANQRHRAGDSQLRKALKRLRRSISKRG